MKPGIRADKNCLCCAAHEGIEISVALRADEPLFWNMAVMAKQQGFRFMMICQFAPVRAARTLK
jgi:hypothetical protein